MFAVINKHSSNLSDHKFYWCSKLYLLMRHMAKLNTNAVLKVLANVDNIEVDYHYPETGITFSGNKWRVYYHCHESVSTHPDEHGHFHLFTDIGDNNWAHVTGLSIDAEGQPLQWFLTNRWVTGGTWLTREKLLEQLMGLVLSVDDDMVGNWLCILLHLYSDTLFELYDKRDEKVEQDLDGRSKKETLNDRNIYSLATGSINLQSILEQYLLNTHAKTA